jgi:hypothetical protein
MFSWLMAIWGEMLTTIFEKTLFGTTKSDAVERRFLFSIVGLG